MHVMHKMSIFESVTKKNDMSVCNYFNYRKLGLALKAIRETKGLTQEYVGKKSGVGQSLYSRFELGKVQIYIHKILDVCAVLGVSPFLLFYCAGYKQVYSSDGSPAAPETTGSTGSITENWTIDAAMVREILQKMSVMELSGGG